MKRFFGYLVAAAMVLTGFSACTVDEESDDDGDYGAGYRAAKSDSSMTAEKVFEYMPAPGQFINEGFDVTTMAAACSYAEGRLAQQYYVSLGGWGGYIVVGFDHSIPNKSGYDLRIRSNAIDNSSEPGIVWVMQDSNGNGFPDDTWYELAGSGYGTDKRRANYSVTYYRPSSTGQPVEWRDVDGTEGEIDYIAAEHSQDYYYPAWITADSYTLSGTCVEARNYDQSGNGSYWVQAEYEWGYADNFSNIDRLSDEGNSNASANANYFKISNAIDSNGKSIHLKYIDFIKVQTACNTKSGWLGENSTEIFGFFDYSITKEQSK